MRLMNSNKNKLNSSKNKINSKKKLSFQPIPNTTYVQLKEKREQIVEWWWSVFHLEAPTLWENL